MQIVWGGTAKKLLFIKKMIVLYSCLDYEDAAQWLIQNGADINAADSSNNSALMIAVYQGIH